AVLVDHQIVINEQPKTDSSRRTISIDPETVTALRVHRKRQLEERVLWGPAWTDGGHVFTKEDGTVLHPERVTKWLRLSR
ncbi:MAG: site-specific integrase, partial [Acidimicrobiales bacterium]